MTKKLLAILISVILVVSCMAVPAFAADDPIVATWDGGGSDVVKGQSQTLQVTVPVEGNYEVAYDGIVLGKKGDNLTFVVQADGQTLMYAVEYNGDGETTHEKVGSTVIGTLALKAGTTDVKFTNISTAVQRAINARTIELTFTRQGDYDDVATHTVYTDFRAQMLQGVGGTTWENNQNSGSQYGYDVGKGDWKVWEITVPESGTYEIYMYGGVQASTEQSLKAKIYVFGDRCDVELPWISAAGSNNNGWTNRKIFKLGELKFRKGVNYFRYYGVSGANTQNSSDNKLYLKRKDNATYTYVPSASVTKQDIFINSNKWYTEVGIASSYVNYSDVDMYLVFYDDKENIVENGVQKQTWRITDTTKYMSFSNIPVDIEYDHVKLLMFEAGTLTPLTPAYQE